MKYIKLCFILFTITLLTTSSNYINTINLQNNVYALKAIKKPEISKDKVLTNQDLKMLFPDTNFRNSITRNFKNQEITLTKIANLPGEFYATGEKIESLEGISYLKGIQNFVFVNNNIKELPNEILKLNKMKSINLLNNYITENFVIDKLIKKDINVNYNLNFIKNKDNQYKLESFHKDIILNKDDKLYLDKLIYKNIKNKEYKNYWEITNEMPVNIKYSISIYNDKVLNLEDVNVIKAISPGESTIKISLEDNFYDNSTVIINIKVQ